jgi:hypothetical protein
VDTTECYWASVGGICPCGRAVYFCPGHHAGLWCHHLSCTKLLSVSSCPVTL